MFDKAIHILVVDDMPAIREMVKMQLRNMGYQTLHEAADGEQAWNLLNDSRGTSGQIGLVISDWNMPKLSGLDFLKRVRASNDWNKLPFVLLTSESERDQVTDAILAGVSQYVVKPFAPKIFEDKLRAAWAKHQK